MNLYALTHQFDREHDSCGIFASVEKSGIASKRLVEVGIDALKALTHRGGYVFGEGDGCGLMFDIPRNLWRGWLSKLGLDADLVDSDGFYVGHLLLPSGTAHKMLPKIREFIVGRGADLLMTRVNAVDSDALGPMARAENPDFVQIAGLMAMAHQGGLVKLALDLESEFGIHVMSLDRSTVVYKVVGDGETLWNYYRDLQDPFFATTFVLAHNRYSTNTTTSFARVQPFSILGHNGEINTVTRLYSEAHMIDIDIDPQYSDSQALNTVLWNLTEARQWSLFEAAELLFPPLVHEIKSMPQDLADMYMFYRALWGPFAQGPAAVMMRKDKEAVFSVDALGLRPMWLLESADAFYFSSEQGIVPVSEWTADPKPLAPGEKVGIAFGEDGVRLYSYAEFQRVIYDRASARYAFSGESNNIHFAGPYFSQDVSHTQRDEGAALARAAAFGWRADDLKLLDFSSQTSNEAIRSLGYDGPLPALDEELHVISDFVQETVAVVTNPAIDREREIEHFSTRTLLGKRPSLLGVYQEAPRVELHSPVLLEQLRGEESNKENMQVVAHRHGTLLYEDALAALHVSMYGTAEIHLHRLPGEKITAALDRFRQEAVEAVQAGANVIVLDDRLQFSRGEYIDPFLAIGAVHQALLRPASARGGEYLRRRTSLILRSGSVRNLHDIMVAIGLGANAVSPYLMWQLASERNGVAGIENLYLALCKGMEKVISTVGIHEIRGYERLFSGIGLNTEISNMMAIPNFYGSVQAGFGLAEMEQDAKVRRELFEASDDRAIQRQKPFQMYPRIWKSAGQVARQEVDYGTYYDRLTTFEREHPVSLRHLLALPHSTLSDPDVRDWSGRVDASIDGHDYPLVISSMSFGSQGETAYRAYAEAAKRLNIVAMNGEGGEIKDILTAYPRNRGRQIASGRFGVNAELCNGAYILEIKIGQGAKPGEGGHLPGSKVTTLVANARNAAPGVDLISPSNNHDIYSIEDLAQVIHELREINPEARIAVKVPVVPNIGTIAVGIVKAGADVVSLSGFDGGTGAARAHALRHVGLPVEIGLQLAHDALCASGLRDACEIWADGGMKSGGDVMKAILLGANRVGFGTMAMVAIGCTSCRACHKDTCHVGIATQMTSHEEAAEKGIKSFSPREFEASVAQLMHLFQSVGEHVKELTAQLGATRTQDLVGRRDLLSQVNKHNHVDLSGLTRVQEQFLGMGSRIAYRSSTQQITSALEQTLALAAGTESVEIELNASSVQSVDDYTGGRSSIVAAPRALGTRESGHGVRNVKKAKAHVEIHTVAGNGFAAYHTVGMVSVARGGAQDGVAKGAYGGKITVLKQRSADGEYRGGSVGKGLAYGAQHGLVIVQGDADARAGIRLSGADLVLGGAVQGEIRDDLGFIGARSNLKGFAFEYMTAGRALVLGDPGPWICSGMTGGSVYLRFDPSIGLTETALRRRIAKGAKVTLSILDDQGQNDVRELLHSYQRELKRSGQVSEADGLSELLARPMDHFRMIRPGHEVTDQSMATE